MAQIGGLRRSGALESEAETGQAPFSGNDETEESHRDGRRRFRRGGRAPRKTSGNLTAVPADAVQLEFTPEPDALGGDMGEKSAGRARRGRRAPRAPRAGRGREAAAAPNAASAFATDDRQVQAHAVAPQGDESRLRPRVRKPMRRGTPIRVIGRGYRVGTGRNSVTLRGILADRHRRSSPPKTLRLVATRAGKLRRLKRDPKSCRLFGIMRENK